MDLNKDVLRSAIEEKNFAQIDTLPQNFNNKYDQSWQSWNTQNIENQIINNIIMYSKVAPAFSEF